MTEFRDLVSRASGGQLPYAYQQRLADEGLPDVLRVPTGTGKTMAAVLPWLYRRRHHPDPAVRRATTRRLVFVLPQRTLVEQTVAVIDGWLDNLGETAVARHVLMGGVDPLDRDWRSHPDQDAIFVGTSDMILSRLLMRGYAEPRGSWPMSFGLLHADSQFVFDEVQLMGPGLPTSLQLHGLREKVFGAAAPCRSMWMSATLDVTAMGALAPDLGPLPTVVELTDEDRAGPLRPRLEATRVVTRVEVDPRAYARELAALALAEHTPATRTLIVLNTVDRAGEVHAALAKQKPAAQVVLLHSRFRPDDRDAHTRAATAEPPPADGVIVVSTQVLEAGVDITSELLVTEAAPWSSIVQRAGRCNRNADATHPRLLWTEPPRPEPYDADRLARSVELLDGLEGEAVTSTLLQGIDDGLPPPLHPVLRRRDLVDLFDTAPDLDGNDIDVAQWIRDGDDLTISLAWRDLPVADEEEPFPGRAELCPAPVTETRKLVEKGGARVYDQRDGGWRPARRTDVRPGAVIVLDAAAGGYLPDRGFAPGSSARVEPVPRQSAQAPESMATDPLSRGPWITLAQHLGDVEKEAHGLLVALDPTGITAGQRVGVVLAGRYHDLGKAHPTFDASLRRASEPDGDGPWAKSPGGGPLRHKPRYFRHELVSALLLLDPATGLLDGVAEPDLVTYLVLAHHGKVRLSVRGRPDEPFGRVLGVDDGCTTLPATLPDGTVVPPTVLSLEATRMGRDGLTGRALRLRDRADLGPFRLAFLEALVRAADWRVSASYEVDHA